MGPVWVELAQAEQSQGLAIDERRGLRRARFDGMRQQLRRGQHRACRLNEIDLVA